MTLRKVALFAVAISAAVAMTFLAVRVLLRSPETGGTWSPLGDAIVYGSNSGGSYNIFTNPSSGSGEAKLLAGGPFSAGAPDWSPDQRYLIYEAASRETQGDLFYRERRNDGSLGDPVVVLQTPFDERAPRFSPDGRFVVYESNESEKYEIFVRSFPSGTNKWQISANTGTAESGRQGDLLRREAKAHDRTCHNEACVFARSAGAVF